jgi:hypothetical protein
LHRTERGKRNEDQEARNETRIGGVTPTESQQHGRVA